MTKRLPEYTGEVRCSHRAMLLPHGDFDKVLNFDLAGDEITGNTTADPMTSPEDSASAEAHKEINRIVDEYRDGLSEGKGPNLEALINTYPQFAGELRHRLAPVDDLSEARTVISTDDLGASGSQPKAPLADHLPAGATLGDFRLIRKLGQGGMGVVYKAEHTKTGRPLAVKLLSPDLPHSDETSKRFLNEASLAASLSHPRTTFVYEAGENDGDFFIAMELMPGTTLQDIVREEGPLPVQRAVD